MTLLGKPPTLRMNYLHTKNSYGKLQFFQYQSVADDVIKISLRHASKAMHLLSFSLWDGEINRVDEIYVWAVFKKEKKRPANR